VIRSFRKQRSMYSHEATHVATLKSVLGSKAVKSPSFDFKGTTRKWSTFLRTAKVLEDTGVAADSRYSSVSAKLRIATSPRLHQVEKEVSMPRPRVGAVAVTAASGAARNP
jgi:hypothetical protein